MYFWLLLQIYLCDVWLVLWSSVTYYEFRQKLFCGPPVSEKTRMNKSNKMNSGAWEEGGWGWERGRGRAVRSGRMRLLMREKWKNRAMWRSEREMKKQRKDLLLQGAHPSFISANVFTISLWATMQKSFLWYSQVLHQSRKLPWANRSFSALWDRDGARNWFKEAY